MSSHSDLARPNDTFARRHLGDNAADTAAMLAELGFPTVDALVDAAVPPHIRRGPLALPVTGCFGTSSA
jgi:glycine dehydrogenase